jgi:hypothetical protein
MEDLSLTQKASVTIAGPLYAFLYYTSRRRLLGITFAGWLKFLSLLFAFVAWIRRWPVMWIALGILLTFAFILLYWKAKRDGYIRFMAFSKQNTPEQARMINEKERIPVTATGPFSTSHQEANVLQKPAEYWPDSNGDKAIMVQYVPGRFLYQFIQPGTLQEVESGCLVFGLRPQNTLAITFLTDWTPEFAEQKISLFNPIKKSNQSKLLRIIYLSFEDNEDKQAVWRNVLHHA